VYKCCQCEKKAVTYITLGDKDKRHVCGKHYQLFTMFGESFKVEFHKASEKWTGP